MTSNQTGFSLIEVLISFVVLTVGVLGLIKLQTYMAVKSENALHSIDALYLAEDKLEYFRTRSQSAATGTILHSSIEDSTETLSMAGQTVTREVKVDNDTPVVGAKKINVKVSWTDRWNNSQSVALDTVISKYSEFD
ncbi:prepilin-type N-terminal cleavage/methylation domain-containing protein [Photobacterium sp. SDRW27]|uniref:type IV pilus modification PilV family protein n=1 Tax=Photobacterium obscurum TaxID=2829490 RepID=UPI002244D382|nr:prepilin-type N-terminal cleavage/methylation domain-containing protein [Photobacterium obscurum]MCW8331979.1 prepilin-type N-terminal cleavage/methylation domain-containing protein [Photobacterium obscurum]